MGDADGWAVDLFEERAKAGREALIAFGGSAGRQEVPFIGIT